VYKNASRILPPRLLAELQRYVAGESIYVPAPGGARRGWGERSGARATLARRNAEIRRLRARGASPAELADAYNLSDDTIRKILSSRSRG
jgi:Mor family transcriptional regulator